MITYIKKWLNSSLFKKLFISYTIVVIIPVLLITYYTYNRFAYETEYNFQVSSNALLRSIESNISLYFSDFERVTANALISKNIQDILKSRDDEFSRDQRQIVFDKFRTDVLGRRADVEDTYLIGLDNYIYYLNGSFPILYKKDVKETEWFEKIAATDGQQTISFGFSSLNDIFPKNHKVISIARLLKDSEMKPIGAMIIELRLDKFSKLFENSLAGDKRLVITDMSGNILYDQNYESIGLPVQTVYSGIFHKNGAIRKTTSDGELNISSAKTDTDWNLILLSKSNELKVVQFDIAFPTLVIGCLCAVIFMLLSLLFTKSITKPVIDLRKSMARVEEGDFTIDENMKFEGELGELAISYHRMVKKINDLINEVYISKIHMLDSEYRALQAQINPHFLYNVLEEVNCLAQLEESERISKMVRKLAKTFRYCIGNRDEMVEFREELENVRDYVFLITEAYDDNFTFSVDVEPVLQKLKVPRLILQPIVENAIIHGVDKTSRSGVVKITANVSNDVLAISVFDNGCGIEDNVLAQMTEMMNSDDPEAFYKGRERKSIGLLNIHKRIRILYGSAYGITINTLPGESTEVILTLRIRNGMDKN
jgi:two-component system sensor histidine kinase YesM